MQSAFSYKIIVLGDSGVGKTCLTIRYTEKYYSETNRCTIGVDFKLKNIVVDEIKIRLNIFDTAGQETYRSVVKNYFNQVDAVVFAYSINNRPSFDNVRTWLTDFQEATDNKSALKILVGTKCDRQQDRQVTKQQGNKLMQQLRFLLFFETSAKTNAHVDQVFQQIGKNLLIQTLERKKQAQLQSPKQELRSLIEQESKQSKSRCC